MKKIKAVWKNGKLMFDHFIVNQESDCFVGVYCRRGDEYGVLITSATTLKGAAQKAKLLEIGWQMGEKESDDFHRECCQQS